MRKINVTKDYAREFDEQCARVDAHGYLKFLFERNENDISIFDLIKRIGEVSEFKPSSPDRDIELNEEIISSYVNEFYSKYFPDKAEEAKHILNKTHPYFIDKDGNSHINFVVTQKGDPRSSCVGHSRRNEFLDFNVYIHGAIDDIRATAHEVSHALSNHHKHKIDLIRSDAPQKEFDDFVRMDFNKDCVGEIESLITEKLFNKYLLEKGIYSENDIENYNRQQNTSLLNETNLIKEERDILRFLPCPVTYESLNKLVENLYNDGREVLMDRVGKMHDGQNSSSYMFRYVVGRVVSDQWIKKYDSLQDKDAQNEMLKNFQIYLDKTGELDLNSACKELLDKDFACIVEDYVKDRVNEREEDYDDEVEL